MSLYLQCQFRYLLRGKKNDARATPHHAHTRTRCNTPRAHLPCAALLPHTPRLRSAITTFRTTAHPRTHARRWHHVAALLAAHLRGRGATPAPHDILRWRRVLHLNHSGLLGKQLSSPTTLLCRLPGQEGRKGAGEIDVKKKKKKKKKKKGGTDIWRRLMPGVQADIPPGTIRLHDHSSLLSFFKPAEQQHLAPPFKHFFFALAVPSLSSRTPQVGAAHTPPVPLLILLNKCLGGQHLKGMAAISRSLSQYCYLNSSVAKRRTARCTYSHYLHCN